MFRQNGRPKLTKKEYEKKYKNSNRLRVFNNDPTPTNFQLIHSNEESSSRQNDVAGPLIKRKSYNEYEELTVEKLEKVEVIPKDCLISIKDNFDEVGRIAFSNCQCLNQIQTIVYDVAYNSNRNMLVAAPTGAGKTNIAMMTTLNELKNWFHPNTTKQICNDMGEKFKIVYIAPMKSLATEQTANFDTRLKKLGIRTRELTGDMSLTEREIAQTHIIVTTPEKWDVVTRKSKGDTNLLSLVRLMIIDEIHLLQSDRGPVLEALVARTLRFVESSQKMTRIVGLSATLPNFQDVAEFLRVDPNHGLFYFDNSYRPVPLTQTFMGVRAIESNTQARVMDKICYNLIVQNVMQSKQVMIFVHARNSTQKVATKLRELIQLNNKLELFQPDLTSTPEAAKLMNSPKNNLLRDFFNIGFGIHHAGMIRQDRLLVENLFRMGLLKVLVCTSTLAWGVNFPAHTVIIRGTEIYDSALGKFTDIGLLDVTQIFGRAGRPQYDTEGNAIIISPLDKMDSYLKLLTNQTPIESKFTNHLADNLNAEVVSGTVSTIEEAMEWLKYTYLNVRLAQNPLNYGFEEYEVKMDPSLMDVKRTLIERAARELDEAQMCRFNEDNKSLEATDLGRIASHFYIKHQSILLYHERLRDELEPEHILELIAEAQEFQQIKFREEEGEELNRLRQHCHYPITGGTIKDSIGKVNCLIQAYINNDYIKSHSLLSDIMYISQNATRIGRGLFEYSLRRGWPQTSLNLLKICKMIEQRMWNDLNPLRQFGLEQDVILRLESSKLDINDLWEKTPTELAKIVNYPDRMGTRILEHIGLLPYVEVDGAVRPIKSNLISMEVSIEPKFKWNDRYHGKTRQSFWFWIVDEEITKQIYHCEHIKFTKEQVQKKQVQHLRFYIPLVDDALEDGVMGQRLPNEYVVYISSDEFNGCDYEYPICCRKIILPQELVAYTSIPTNLNQLSLSVIQNDLLAEIFRCKEPIVSLTNNSMSQRSGHKSNEDRGYFVCLPPMIESFNILQSQVFHSFYHSDKNILLCGPPGSGKTLMADIALLRVFAFKDKGKSQHKIIYVTPIESLARLKYCDWQSRIGEVLGRQITLLTLGNYRDLNLFNSTNIIVTSSLTFRNWLQLPDSQTQLESTTLIIYDDLHLLSDKRGSDLEIVISQVNHLKTINNRIKNNCRIIGISNTITNAHNLANWLGLKRFGAYNFHPATSRPIQLDMHFVGFSERHYSPRMASMNKPIYKSICYHSPKDPVIIFVSSKKQCVTTSQDLMSCLAEYQAYQSDWLKIDLQTLKSVLSRVDDDKLRLSLEFGIAFMHPSMKASDKMIVSELFLYNKVQILICTTNYAWETNYHARLVIVKGTEHYDEELERFTEYLQSDVMQMLGRAGRPGIDSTGVSILMIRDIHKEFYKKFLYETFPVESRLLQSLQHNPAGITRDPAGTFEQKRKSSCKK